MRENRFPAGRTGGAIDPLACCAARAQYYCGQTVYVPQLGNVVITEEHIMQAEMLKITVGQLLDIEPMSPLVLSVLPRLVPLRNIAVACLFCDCLGGRDG